MPETYDEYEALQLRSNEFLEEARDAFRKGRYNVAVILAEQSVQLKIKACLLLVTGSYPRIHQIRVLLKELGESIGGSWGEKFREFIRHNRAMLAELEDVYIIARYTPKVYSREDAEDLLGLVAEVLKIVNEACESFKGKD